MLDLKGKVVIVTGGAGFFGKHVVKLLKEKGAEVGVPRSEDFDLTKMWECERLFDLAKPNVVIHMAAKCGGIGANRERPGEFFYDNMAMGINVIECCRKYNVEKLTLLSTVCSYPRITPVPFKEEDLWAGFPEETNAPYGIAKKSCMVMGQAYRQQYGMNIITLIPVNLMGPGDSLDLEKNHVIPALIKKFVTAKDNGDASVEVWGSGKPSREFLYVEDAAKAVVLATERYDGEGPVNLGSGQEITIKELVKTIKELVGYKGKVRWNTDKPDGQPRRCLDTTKAEQLFGFKAETSLKDGLKKTIDWYNSLVESK